MVYLNTTSSSPFDSSKQSDPLRHAWHRSYPGLATIGLFSVFINILKLTIPLYVLQILDRVVASRSLETLFMLIVIAVASIICAVVLEVVRRRMFIHWGSWIEFCFGPVLFANGLKSESGQSPTTSKMLRDLATLRSFVSGSGIIAWLDAVWAPLFIGCVYLISSTLGYIVFTACLLALVLGVLNEFLSRDSREASYQARKDDRDWVASAERNQETVESLNMSTNFAERWSTTAFTKLGESMRGKTLHLYFSSAMIMLARFLRITVLGVGVWLLINQAITLGAVIAANVLGRISYSLVQNAMLRWREVVTAKRAYLRVKSSLTNRTLSTISLPDDMKRVSLTISNLRYRYPHNNTSIFRNLNLILNPGEILFVVGSSASGKTTFARLVTGLLTPRDGNVRLGEVDLFRLQQRTQTHEVGKLPQDVILFPGTVRENIARMSEGQMDMVIQAAKFAGVHDAIIGLPAGYDTVIQENEPLLSFGQRKGIALARAFYGQPQLIVLDEPVPHLDHQARSDLLTGMRRMNQIGSIIVLTTQSISLCKYADKVLVLNGDRHRVLQSPDEILSFQKEKLLSHRDQRKGGIRRNNIRSVEAENGSNDSKQRSA